MTVISVFNQKGGVGKTTTVVSLGAVFASLNKKVLIVDFDPQGNANRSFGVDRDNIGNKNIYRVLSDEVEIEDSIMNTNSKNLDIIACNQDLLAVEQELYAVERKEFYLSDRLKKISSNYDFVLIDCPPSISLLSINALVACSFVLIPIQCQYFALQGLADILRTAKAIEDNFNPKIKICGIALTMYAKNYTITKQIEDEIRGACDDLIYDTVIPTNVKIVESQSMEKPIIEYDPMSSGAIAYANLGKEILMKLNIKW
ncbi:MAG: AAA family ATPase [Rickettsiales bacterium]|jgi:chromosome partitioning protein|nr:AAA family ATPase [Rickettsiales bacterium]